MSISNLLKNKTPRFLSVDIGQSSVKIIHGEYNREPGFEILHYDIRRFTPPDNRYRQASDLIRNFLLRNAIQEKEAGLTVSDFDAITIKYMTVAAPNGVSTYAALCAAAGKDSLFSRENVLLDWQSDKETSGASGGKERQVMCAFAKKYLISACTAALNECGLKAVSITCGPFNYGRIIRHTSQAPSRAAVVDIGFKDTIISVFKDGALQFIRGLVFSSDKLTQSLTGTLILESGKQQFSYEKAEEIKREFGIPADENAVITGDVRGRDILGLLRPYLDGVSHDIRASLDYYARCAKDELPAIVYLTGGGANVKNLSRGLQEGIGIPVEALPAPGCVVYDRVGKDRMDRDYNQIMNALGAGFRRKPVDIAGMHGERQADARIPDMPQKPLRKRLMFGRALLMITLLIVVIRAAQIFWHGERIRLIRGEIQSLGDVRLVRDEIGARERLLRRLRMHKAPAEALLTVISAAFPEGIVMRELILDQMRHEAIMRVGSGRTAAQARVLTDEFARKLKDSPGIADVSYETDGGAEPVYTVRCRLE